MAATACPIGENGRPVTKKMTPKIRNSPPRNAASNSIRREAWAFSFAFIGSSSQPKHAENPTRMVSKKTVVP